jgi:hypothetical protein
MSKREERDWINLFIAIFLIVIVVFFFTYNIIVTFIIPFASISVLFTILITFCLNRPSSILLTLHTTLS